jgi:hypothetical protein
MRHYTSKALRIQTRMCGPLAFTRLNSEVPRAIGEDLAALNRNIDSSFARSPLNDLAGLDPGQGADDPEEKLLAHERQQTNANTRVFILASPFKFTGVPGQYYENYKIFRTNLSTPFVAATMFFC